MPVLPQPAAVKTVIGDDLGNAAPVPDALFGDRSTPSLAG
jgi:hypothetical protein